MWISMDDDLPEVVFCSYCGRNIWAIINKNTDPKTLICKECKDKERYKNND